MKPIHLTILKYLDKNYSTDFIDVCGAFSKNNLPSRGEIEDAFEYLKEYIDLQSVYESGAGFLFLDDTSNYERPLQKARINKKGIDFLLELKEKEAKTKRERIIIILTVITIIVAILALPLLKGLFE